MVAGEYVAIVGEAIVAHGKSFNAVADEADRHGLKPYFYKVPLSDKALVI